MNTRVVGAAAVLVLLAACGSGGDGTEPASTPAAATPSASAHAGHTGHRAPPPPPAAPLKPGERFLSLTMPRPYRPDPPTAGGTDDYRCFLVDPGFASTTFLVGSQFLPQNADVVHHAIFFRVPASDVAGARALDAEAPGDGWTCFGGTGIGGANAQARSLSNAPWVAAWAPGAGESVAAPGTGTLMEAGSQLVMQVHYNLLATGGKSIGTDRSGIRLRLAPGNARLEPLKTRLLTAPIELPCPPGVTGKLCDRDLAVWDVIRRFGDEAGWTVAGLNLLCNNGRKPVPGDTQHCDRKISQPGYVMAAAGHMHLLGRSITIELNPGTKRARTLLDVPVYNFDDQGARKLARPVAVKAGDTMRVTCTHDATLRARLPELKPLKPRYVVWGEGTSDEMCLGVVVYTEHLPKAAA
jgi:hypothetical protein